MRVTGVLVFALIIGVGAVLSSQAPQPTAPQPGQPTAGQPTTPQRRPARPLRPGEAPPKGTAMIRGQVMAAGSGTPVRRAQVRVMSMEGGGGGVTSTDADGRFEIRDLPAGRYSVTATKGGYVAGQFGQRRPGDQGTPIDLIDAQTAERVNFALARGGVIAGRILDESGEPVSGTQVMALRYAFSAGTRRLMPAPSEGSNDRTDDQGGFRLYGLPPGDYFVSAVNRAGMMAMPNVTNTEPDGFAPTYFPGTPNIAEASRIALRVGQEMTGATFALTVARLARVSGRAINSRGEPIPRAMLMLTPSDATQMVSFNMNNAMAAPDGAFQFVNVAPGRYHINVRPTGSPTDTTESAMMPVVVGNDDIDNVLVITSLGAVARGIILTDDGALPAFRPSEVRIFANPVEPMMNFTGMVQPRVNEDFTFELPGLFDRRMIRGAAGPGWYLKAVMLDSEDVTDRGVEFTPGRNVEGLQVIFTQKTTDLSGAVTDDRGRPVLDATVVVFPADQDKWSFQSRYVRTARPDTEGRYNIKSLPPDLDYLVIALQNLEQGQAGDPEFLTRARDEAKSFSLNEGEIKAVDVKLSTLVP